jgi:hypothetical protein
MRDVRAVNGFNNLFEGWGREDSEFVERLFNYGLKGNYLSLLQLGITYIIKRSLEKHFHKTIIY